MKKILAVIVLGCCFILFLIFHFSSTERPATIPFCFVMSEGYFTNDPRYYEEKISDNYELYGTITYLVDNSDEEKDLSTNYNQYINKEVYVDKSDVKYIYLKYAESKYLKLYFEPKN